MKFFSALALMLLFCSLQAQESGIAFSSQSWDDILAEAKANDQIIFVDAFTTWCGPCKMMDRDVFSDETVGKLYNETFVNAKIDMEKGVGLELAKNYSVRAYPSFLFIDGDGKLVHRGLGYQPAEQFIELGKVAMDDKRNLGGLSTRYDAGERDPELLKSYASALSMAMDDKSADVADAYLASQKDWNTPGMHEFIMEFATKPDSKAFQYLKDNRAAFEAQFGKSEVIGHMQNVIFRDLMTGKQERPSLEELNTMVVSSYPDLGPVIMARYNMTYHQRSGDMEQYQKAAVVYVETFKPDNFNELNSIAWTFYESVEDPALLKKALAWAKKSVELDKQYHNMDTLAALYFKTGDKKKGRKVAEEAIEMAKAAGMDYAGTQDLIDQHTK